MANFTRSKQASASGSWQQQIARGLIFAVVICRLVLSAHSQQKETSNLASDQLQEQQQQQQQQQTTNGCDSLFIANEKLAKYCLCKDQDLVASVSADQPASGSRDEQLQRQQISQLSCQPNDLTVLSKDLAAALGAWGQHESLQIDYLNINTNITSVQSIAPAVATNTIAAPASDRWPLHQGSRRFQIDHISLQFQMSRDESPPPAKSQQRSDQAESQPATVWWVENQMIDFCGLINETRLQFFSISVGGGGGGGDNYHELLDSGGGEIRLTKLLSKFSSLTRLELSVDSKLYSLLVERETFRHQPQLKWLSLASNRNLKLVNSPELAPKKRSPFSWATQLEYLSLESCNLRSFPLFSLFQIQFKLASNQQQQQQQQQDSLANASHITTKSVLGLPNLTTLNLASNKLRSLELDLFASIDNATDATRTICQQDSSQPDPTSSRVFVLPSLTQLDLSENRLDALGFRAAQYILCTMPNLSQLFLRRNNIKHLNLNSLLVYPTILPHSIASQLPATSSSSASGRPSRSSRLEYVDLSSNELVQVSAFLPPAQDPSIGSTRIKSINLSQNKLTNLVTLLNSSLVDRLVFDESFNYGPSSDSTLEPELRLNHLERWFKLAPNHQSRPLSICDYLSPGFSRKATNNNNMEESLVNELLMEDNRLTRVTRDDFAGQQCADIQILRMSANRIQSIGEGSFDSLQNLEQLDLGSNQLVGLNASTFVKNLKLRILNLSRNKLKTIERRLFANLNELEELLLNNNELVEIPGELFAHATRLSVLDLSSNGLDYLEEATFSNLSQLRVLTLNDNNLRQANYLSLFRHIDNGIVVKTMNIFAPQQPKKSTTRLGGGGGGAVKKQQKHMSSKAIEHSGSKRMGKTRHNRDATSIESSSNLLDLSRNQIESFNHAGLDSCNNQTFVRDVQTLWLNDNKLRELSPDSFSCFASIQRLHLSSNQLQTLEDATFESLLELEFVDLSRNQLKRIHLFKLLPPSAALKQADLSHNQLATLNLSTSQTETQIELLDVSYNVDLSIDLLDLVELIDKSAALRSLRLAGIKLTDSSGDKQAAIKNRLFLQSLDLSGSTMDLRAIAQLHHLLSSDQISAIESLLVAQIPDAVGQTAVQRLIATRLSGELELLNLSGNKLDNELVKSIMNANETQLSLKHLNVSSNLLDSWPLNEKLAAKLSELKSLDLNRNKIRYLINKSDSLACYTLGQLEYLNLSSNAMINLIAQPPTQNMQKISLGQLMPSLRSIDLSHNRLSWIPAQFFDDMPQLVRLRLDHNQIETFPANLLLANDWPARLVQLNFDHNKNMRLLAASADTGDSAHDQLDRLLLPLLNEGSKFILATGDGFNQLRCSQVDEYVSVRQQKQQPAPPLPPLNVDIGSESQYLHSIQLAWQDKSNSNSIEPGDENEHCQTLISLTRSISFNSIGPNATAAANLAALWSSDTAAAAATEQFYATPKLYDLSFRRNDLRTIDTSFQNRLVIRMDLSENRIEKLPSASSSCRWPHLMTLELSRNQIGAADLSLDWSLDCAHLTYLDLSHNRISSFTSSSESNRRLSSLLVLKLDHNSLTNLDGFPSHLLADLRLLDLSSNQLKSLEGVKQLELQRPLLTVIGSNSTLYRPEVDVARPNIRIDDTSLRFDWTEDVGRTMSVTSGKAISYREKAANHAIKFCQLEANSLTRVCLQEEQIPGERCLILRVPQNTLPCSTDLKQSLQANKNSSSSDTKKSSSTQDQPFASGRNPSVADVEGSKLEEDLVLNFIDSMKKSWLKWREVDINEYLNENMKANSVWVELGNRYQINSLTMVKFAIVIGSICIISLLIAVFTLLTYFSSSKVGPADSDAGSASELTTVTSPDSTSFSSSTNTNNHNRSALTDCSNRSSDGSRTRTSLQSTSEEGQHLQETVLERIASKGSPDQHNIRQQHPQICVTPSPSSLAPSSIETAETMQAVDSIQSGTPNIARGSVDQYTSAADMSNYQSRQQHEQQLYQQQQQQQQQVATVMRMVKSSSANFDCNADGQRVHAPASSGVAAGHYGTLNSRQNYSTLRTKLRHHGRPSIQQVDDGSHQHLLDMTAEETLAYNQQLGGLDTTTMSLLSLRSALSNSSSANNFAASLQTEARNAANCEDDNRPNQHNHLCQYHSNIMQHTRQPVFVNQTHHHLAAGQQAPEVIFEHDEEQQLSSYTLDPSLQLAVHSLPPPPPPPRTMEALEFYDLNNSYTNTK